MTITAKFSVEAGVAVRGSIKRAIMALAHSLPIEIAVREEKGFLESVYLFTVTGPEIVVQEFVDCIVRNFGE